MEELDLIPEVALHDLANRSHMRQMMAMGEDDLHLSGRELGVVDDLEVG